MLDRVTISKQIKAYALELGFGACGFCRAEDATTERERLQKWLDIGYNAGMDYMSNHFEKRCNPVELVEGACSVVSLALNYYPAQFQSLSAPQIAYYAYGQDYHSVMKDRMQQLFDYIKLLFPNVSGRCFCDTAPILERYWAVKAGVGFAGKNTMLIIPNKGSYFFLGEIILDMELDYDSSLGISCGTCTRCIDACPTKALESPYVLNAKKCISYQTIEKRGEMDEDIIPLLNNRFYGCDICLQTCPWNRFAEAHNTPEFDAPDERLNITLGDIEDMTEENYRRIFKGSAMKRAKFSGLKRNAENLKKTKSDDHS